MINIYKTWACEDLPEDLREIEKFLEAVLNNPDSEYLHFSGQDASGSIPDEFWDHVEIVTGMRYDKRPKYFSCSC